ncbi:MAG TPA: indole-3-glycerol phosphate synthase TrpC [Pyrinomonadaceae bacterium]
MSVLEQILARKRQRVESAKGRVPLESLRATVDAQRPATHRLLTSIQRDGINIIAEYKRRSPSKGIIRADVDVETMVQNYEIGGAAAISVVTEEDYFSGSLDDLKRVRSTVELPVLRKDFVFDPYQIYEAVAAGANAVLLIVAALADNQLVELRTLAEDELGIDALVEVHDAAEMERAAQCGAQLIGVNNRNLHTFEVTLETSLQLSTLAPPTATLVSESGLNTSDDLSMLAEVGYRGFLIGETLMRSDDPARLLQDLAGS